MLQFFRKLFKTRLGAIIAIAFLVLIALAFASGDVANTGNFGGIAGGNRVATVGDDRIDTSTLSQAATSALERARQDNPRMSMEGFLAAGGLEQVLEDMIDRMAVAVFGRQNGIVASERLIDSEVAQLPVFQGPDGNFSQEIFDQAIRQRGISEKLVREDLRQGLIARQMIVPAAFGVVMPRELALRYASLLRETRQGAIAVLPSALFVPEQEPDEKALQAFYNENSERFIRPERRVIRYASFGPTALSEVPEPTDAEIAFRFNQNKERFAASESRALTQLVVPTEAAARAVIAEVTGGTSLEAAALEKGLATAELGTLSRDDLARQTSQAVANAAFSARSGALAAPARSGLGWHVIRVDSIDARPARTLDDAREVLAEEISAEKRRVAVTERLSEIEDGFDEGQNLSEVAQGLGIELQRTKPLLADGQVYLEAEEQAPEVLERVLETAFAMDAQEPQIAEVVPGETFVIFEVVDIAQSAVAPFAEIKDDVTSAYMLDRASSAARDAAVKVRDAVREGKTLQQAMAALETRLPPVQPVRMNREELTRMQQQRQQVAPPLALLFNMAEGTVKSIPAPDDRGWFVVSLDDIEPGKVEDGDPIVETARRELGSVAGNEYGAALRQAIRSQVGVEKNETGIDAVREQLSGGR
ncbi:hypothetical protein GCM10011371_06080 [Novosphingobium marinum]|uniref:Parvulin-like PPIase n=1 Tax=Novosphingobium marinum TaxID=1514948 RepID=A0A7Z0BRX7_9SPHN|nr:peptidylprolyl isomerase [Novosphingobium marinum]NYH94296.1 peptidyl-prolyl cis-trans isomerase D [Novosphingobium marinum]GGC21210.1 hypothetical protein GCM10011371_06080 [Novosphingobium marinum]